MNSLIIDAANDKILFKIISLNKSYTSDYPNSRENFDKLSLLLFNFFKKNNIELKEIDNVFVNQGPGKFSGIRSSIAVAKAISISCNLNLYGFNSNQLKNEKYEKILDLFKKGVLIKNLIKPQY